MMPAPFFACIMPWACSSSNAGIALYFGAETVFWQQRKHRGLRVTKAGRYACDTSGGGAAMMPLA